MRYIFLIYENESLATKRSKEEQETIMAGHMAFAASVRNAGVFLAGDPLLETNTATTVRVRDGKATGVDGPFAETKEQLGGYYILECTDLDQALEYASQIPSVAYGSVEVRPIMEFDG